MSDQSTTNIIYNGTYATLDACKLAYIKTEQCPIDLEKLRHYCNITPGFVLFINYAREGDRLNTHIVDLLDLLESEKVSTVLFLNVGAEWSTTRSNLKKTYKYIQFVFVEYFLWQCYNYLIEQKRQALNTEWNPDADKFLFLTGKYYKTNRAWLLYKIKNQGMLDQCTWSLFTDHYDLEHVASRIPGLSDQQFVKFCREHAKNPDHTRVWYQKTPVDESGYFSTHYTGFPFDVALFEKSRFRIISETWDQSKELYDFFFTEKTWITILNRLPFLLAGSPNMLYNLGRLGFKTFSEYTQHPDYDFFVNDNTRYNAIVDNAKDWMQNIKHKQQIQADIEHNYQRLIELAEKTKIQVQQVIDKCNLTGINIHNVMPLKHWIPE